MLPINFERVTKTENIKTDATKILRPTLFSDEINIKTDIGLTLRKRRRISPKILTDIKTDNKLMGNKTDEFRQIIFQSQSEPSRSSCIVLQLIAVVGLNIFLPQFNGC